MSGSLLKRLVEAEGILNYIDHLVYVVYNNIGLSFKLRGVRYEWEERNIAVCEDDGDTDT